MNRISLHALPCEIARKCNNGDRTDSSEHLKLLYGSVQQTRLHQLYAFDKSTFQMPCLGPKRPAKTYGCTFECIGALKLVTGPEDMEGES